MKLHADGTVEGTPEEIAEYVKLRTPVVNIGGIASPLSPAYHFLIPMPAPRVDSRPRNCTCGQSNLPCPAHGSIVTCNAPVICGSWGGVGAPELM